MHVYIPDRSYNLRQGNYIPGSDGSHNIDYVKSTNIKPQMPSGFNEGEQMHHLIGVESFGPFVQNLSPNEARIVINRANQLGIRVMNAPENFIGVDGLKEHLRNDEYPNTIHSQLDDMGLESSELSGADRAQYKNLQNAIADLPLRTRLDILPDYVTYIAEPSIEVGRQFRPTAHGLAENKALYAREVQDEINQELREHYQELGADAAGLTTDYSAKGLTALINDIRSNAKEKAQVRMSLQK